MAKQPKICILTSSGLDSMLLVTQALDAGHEVFPLYVAWDFPWEKTELRHLEIFLEKQKSLRLHPLHQASLNLRDLFPKLWAYTARIPDAASPDEAVYLPHRNLLLLGVAAAYAQEEDLEEVWLGSLGTNPFPDTSAEFHRGLEGLCRQGYAQTLRIRAPFAGLSKAEIIAANPEFPFALTFSCIAPKQHRHCGRCNKCHERRHYFEIAGIADPTFYQD